MQQQKKRRERQVTRERAEEEKRESIRGWKRTPDAGLEERIRKTGTRRKTREDLWDR
jgi:hypothetical protein